MHTNIELFNRRHGVDVDEKLRLVRILLQRYGEHITILVPDSGLQRPAHPFSKSGRSSYCRESNRRALCISSLPSALAAWFFALST